MKMKQLMEARIAAQMADRDRLTQAWQPIVEAAEENVKLEGRTLTTMQKRNIARMCENALLNAAAGRRRLFETTDSSNIDFLGIQLPIIAAITPSLVLNEIATVQALEKRTGGLFYLNVTAVGAKGGITAGQTLIDAKTGHVNSLTGRRFASQRVEAELLASTTGSQAVTGTLDYLPVIAGSVVVTNGVETMVDNGSNVLVSDTSGGSGTVDYDTGAVTLSYAVPAVAASYAAYKYNYETKTTAPIPEINFDIVQSTVTAEDFPLKSTYTLTSAIDLEKAWGLSLEDEMVKYVSNEIKFSQDHLGIDMMVAAALSDGTTVSAYTVTPSTGETWIWKKFQFLDHVEQCNNAIISATLRMMATFILVGNNGARLIKQLDGHFKPSGTPITQVTGPYVMGELDGRVVVHDPFQSTNVMVFGYKGADWKEAAFAYCPYIPLISTPTVALSTLKVEKGFLSSAAFQVINGGGFCYTSISGY